MIGCRQSMLLQIAALALVSMLSVVAPSRSYASPSDTAGYVNGKPCNDLCKAYMAWTDRVLTASRSVLHPRPPERVAVHRNKAERPVHRAAAPHRSSGNAFAQLVHRSPVRTQVRTSAHADASARLVPEPVVRTAEQPSIREQLSIAEQPSPVSEIAMAAPADFAGAAEHPLQLTPVSFTTESSGNTGTTVAIADVPDRRLPISLALALCALLSLLSWSWLRRGNAGAFN
jgi:hypothetical protein